MDLLLINFIKLQKPLRSVLLNLKDIRGNPPSLDVCADPVILDSSNIQLDLDESNHERGDMDVAVNNIDWDISVDGADIDWDIGTVEETDDGGNGLGPYEIVNASDISQNSSQNEAVESGETPLKKEEENVHTEISVSEICWDISVETPQVDAINDTNLVNMGLENQTYVLDTITHTPGMKEGRSQLLDTEYRNKILDDLYEV